MRIILCCLAVLVVLLAGCTLPEGATFQSSSIGLDLAPFGHLPNTPQLVVGSKTTMYSEIDPEKGPVLNRFQASAPGLSMISTSAGGAGIGDEANKAAGAIGMIHNSPSVVPTPIPSLGNGDKVQLKVPSNP